LTSLGRGSDYLRTNKFAGRRRQDLDSPAVPRLWRGFPPRTGAKS
jgi:hypothetical protein